MISEQVDRDLEVLRPWWRQLAMGAPGGVAGLWFGVVELVVDEQAMLIERNLYVAGCPTFDIDDETAEWATEYVWWPDDMYVVLPGLAGMRATKYEEWVLVLEHAAAVVRALEPQLVVPVQGVAVGFNDGDFVVTWHQQSGRAEG